MTTCLGNIYSFDLPILRVLCLPIFVCVLSHFLVMFARHNKCFYYKTQIITKNKFNFLLNRKIFTSAIFHAPFRIAPFREMKHQEHFLQKQIQMNNIPCYFLNCYLHRMYDIMYQRFWANPDILCLKLSNISGLAILKTLMRVRCTKFGKGTFIYLYPRFDKVEDILVYICPSFCPSFLWSFSFSVTLFHQRYGSFHNYMESERLQRFLFLTKARQFKGSQRQK